MNLLLIGGGGHCKSVIDSIDRTLYDRLAVVDISQRMGETMMGLSIIGCDNDLFRLRREGFDAAFITLGSMGNPSLRKKLFKQVREVGFSLPPIVDKSAVVSQYAIIGEGAFIGKGCLINVDVKIGNCCIINTGVSIDHDCHISDFIHIAPGCILSGNVHVGTSSHIGTGTSIIQGITIGSNTIIGAGSVVTKDIPSDCIAYGCPCTVREIRKEEG